MYADVQLHTKLLAALHGRVHGCKKRLSGDKGSQGQHDMLVKPHHSMYDA